MFALNSVKRYHYIFIPAVGAGAQYALADISIQKAQYAKINFWRTCVMTTFGFSQALIFGRFYTQM